MKKVFKLSIIIFIIILILIIVALFIYSPKRDTTTGLPYIPQVDIQNNITLDEKVVLEVDESNLNLPSSANILITKPLPSISDETINKITSNLEYPNEPIEAEDGKYGKLLIYQSDTDSVTIFPDSNIIEFGSYQPLAAINKQISDEELIDIAQDFLVNELEIEEDKLEFINFVFIKTSGGGERFDITTKENADFFQLNFSPTYNDLPIITTNPRSTPYYVWLLPDGSVDKADIREIGDLQTSSDNIKLKTFDEISNSLDTAILVSIDQGNVDLIDVNSQFIQKISITSIELSYLYDPNNPEILQPIYILSGEASLFSQPENVKAVLYMPAISNPN